MAALAIPGLNILSDSSEAGRSCFTSGYRDYGHRDYGYRRGHASYRTTCRIVHTCYFVRGCHRYKKVTYLHTKTNCYGHVVSRWKTYKTICIGRAHNRYY